jgi:hypothetical protein
MYLLKLVAPPADLLSMIRSISHTPPNNTQQPTKTSSANAAPKAQQKSPASKETDTVKLTSNTGSKQDTDGK